MPYNAKSERTRPRQALLSVFSFRFQVSIAAIIVSISSNRFTCRGGRGREFLAFVGGRGRFTEARREEIVSRSSFCSPPSE